MFNLKKHCRFIGGGAVMLCVLLLGVFALYTNQPQLTQENTMPELKALQKANAGLKASLRQLDNFAQWFENDFKPEFFPINVELYSSRQEREFDIDQMKRPDELLDDLAEHFSTLSDRSPNTLLIVSILNSIKARNSC